MSRSSNGRKAGGSAPHANGVGAAEERKGSGPPPPAALTAQFVQLLQEDDAQGLEAALAAEKERLAARAHKGKAKGGDPSANLKKRLLQYAAACDADECCAYLLDEEEVPIDGGDENGLTPLHHAAQHHARAAVQALFDRGAEGDERSKEGKTPLESAVASPKLHIEWTPHMQATSLVELMQNKDLACLQLLVDMVPASLVVQVAFATAAEGAVPRLVALLLVGSKHIVNAVSGIAEAASATGTLVELLLRKALATSPGAAANKALGGGGVLGPRMEREVALKALEVLLLWNPRLTSRGPEARSPEHVPLLRSARANDAEVVRLLLEAGADVNESDAESNTALHWCLRGPRAGLDVRVVRRLLEHGAACTASNKLGATPVHTAAGHGHAEALRLMLAQEPAAVNVLAATKETALHYAVKNGHAECARMLLLMGANRSVVNVRNQRPADLAASPLLRRLLSSTDPALLSTPIPEAEDPARSASGGSGYAADVDSLADDGWQVQMGRTKAAGQGGHHPKGATSPKVGGHGHASGGSSGSGSPAGGMTIGIGGVQLDANNMPPAKTVLCKFYSSGQGCSWGSSCHFAHNKEELLAARAKQGLPRGGPPAHRDRPTPPSKQAFAPSSVALEAPRGTPAAPLAASAPRPQAAQSAAQQDAAPLQDNRFLKTKLCVRFSKPGGCPRGDKCTYAHGFGELRPWVEGEGSGSTYGSRPATPASVPPSVPATPEAAPMLDGELADKKKVFVGGLPAFVEKDDLWSFFEDKFGAVADAMVAYFPNGASRGFGFVTFQHEKPAASAAKLHYLPFHGKRVEVKFAQPFQERSSASPGSRASRDGSRHTSGSMSPMPLPAAATIVGPQPPPLSLSGAGPSGGFQSPHSLHGIAYAAVAAPQNSRSLPSPIGPPSPSVGVVGQRGAPPGSYAAAAEQQRQAEQVRHFEEHPHFQQPASNAREPQPSPPQRSQHRRGPGVEAPQGRQYEQFPLGPRAAFGNLEGFSTAHEDSSLISELMSSLALPEHAQGGRRRYDGGAAQQNGPGFGPSRQGHGHAAAQELGVPGGNESLDGVCVVCWERKHACVAVPCGHRSLCIPCKEALQQSNADRDCPICRSTVNHWVAVPQG